MEIDDVPLTLTFTRHVQIFCQFFFTVATHKFFPLAAFVHAEYEHLDYQSSEMDAIRFTSVQFPFNVFCCQT